MKWEFEPTGSATEFFDRASIMIKQPEVRGLMVLAGEDNQWTPDLLDPLLRMLDVPLFGGIFPQVLVDQKNVSKGTLIIGLPVVPSVLVVYGLSNPEANYGPLLAAAAEEWGSKGLSSGDTLIVLVDGMSQRIGALVDDLFYGFGLEPSYLGGGAGSITFEQRPCLITPQGLVMDAAIIGHLPVASGIGVAHGWEVVSESVKVTEVDRNVIRSLNWQSPFEVYQSLIHAHRGDHITQDNFFDLAKCYPFGITKLGSEVVVRDPVQVTDEGHLVCVGEVPAGAFIRLLHGSPESLIAAAQRARQLAEEAAAPALADGRFDLLFDCISRVLILGDRIGDELKAAAPSGTLLGAFSLGEIANNGKEYLEFYNKTAVCGVLGAKEK